MCGPQSPPPRESGLEAGALRISLCALERFSPFRGVCRPAYSEDRQKIEIQISKAEVLAESTQPLGRG